MQNFQRLQTEAYAQAVLQEFEQHQARVERRAAWIRNVGRISLVFSIALLLGFSLTSEQWLPVLRDFLNSVGGQRWHMLSF